MIIKNNRGYYILTGGETRIAFAVNTEGCNDSGFAGMIAGRYWPELAYIGECELGTVLTKTSDDGITFYALVCYSLEEGWKNQTEIIKKCFDSIEGDEPIASTSIGRWLPDMLSGADFAQIKDGMELSEKKIILY